MNGSNVPTKDTLLAATDCSSCLFHRAGYCTRNGQKASLCSGYSEAAVPAEEPTRPGFEEFSEQAAQQSAEGRGLRFNQGKVRVDLLPPDAITALANLMTVNELKYPDRNWEKGMPWSDVLASLERHFLELKAGEDVDPTDRQHHAVKIMWNAMAMYCYWWRDIGTDDRVKVGLPPLEYPNNG